MAKKKKITSIDAKSEALQASFRTIKPPAHMELSDGDMMFFENVIAEFAKTEWTNHQLEIAAMLARAMSDLDAQQKQLRIDGYIITRENGTTVENPRSRVVKSLTGDILSLRRSLALHARARGGDNRDVKRTRDLTKEIEDKTTSFDDMEGLIARPVH